MSVYADFERRRVGRTLFTNGATLFTTFLVTDHNMGGSPGPILFETLLGNPLERYATWAQAMEGHIRYRQGYLKANPSLRIQEDVLRDRPNHDLTVFIGSTPNVWEKL